MIKLSVAENDCFEVSTYEIDAKKKSYSIDTLKEFRRLYGAAAQLYFITGSDLLKDLFSWKNVNDIFKISKFTVANRPGYPVTDVPSGVETVVITPIEVSSEDIRRRLKAGQVDPVSRSRRRCAGISMRRSCMDRGTECMIALDRMEYYSV